MSKRSANKLNSNYLFFEFVKEENFLGTMEVQGLTNQAEYERIRALTKVNSPDAAKKIAGFLNKVQINFNLFLIYRFFIYCF